LYVTVLTDFIKGSTEVTCGEVHGWGGIVSFKANFASVWIEWSSIYSPRKWLLADWLLFLGSGYGYCWNICTQHAYLLTVYNRV